MDWISVEYESPPNAEYVLCFTNNGIYSLGIYFYGGGWSLDESVINADYVTHWMKLPAPPDKTQTQMEIVKEALARLDAMTRSEFLSVLVSAGIVDKNQLDKSKDEK